MAFHGDLLSYPLPELLQWLDSSRKSGSFQLSWDAGERKLFVEGGQVVATASAGLSERIARILELAGLASGGDVLAALHGTQGPNGEDAFESRGIDPSMCAELAREELFAAAADLTQSNSGSFHWTEDLDRGGDDWVPANMSLRHLLFESLRWVDENAEVDRALPIDAVSVRAVAPPGAGELLVHRVLLTLSARGQNLGKLRLALGLPRTAIARRVFDLLRQKKVIVEGAPHLEEDPVADMLEKGAILVRERQFEAAGLIFSSLLSSDPADRRVREFARLVEREHVASLYRELPPLWVPRQLVDLSTLVSFRNEERHVAELVNGLWDVSTIVLASQHRELETLKCLARLVRAAVIG